MIILENLKILILPTSTLDLAKILYTYSTDWENTLEFLYKIADKKGIFINKSQIITYIREWQEQDNGKL